MLQCPGFRLVLTEVAAGLERLKTNINKGVAETGCWESEKGMSTGVKVVEPTRLT